MKKNVCFYVALQKTLLVDPWQGCFSLQPRVMMLHHLQKYFLHICCDVSGAGVMEPVIRYLVTHFRGTTGTAHAVLTIILIDYWKKKQKK